jgi:hypothetical protein
MFFIQPHPSTYLVHGLIRQEMRGWEVIANKIGRWSRSRTLARGGPQDWYAALHQVPTNTGMDRAGYV